MKIYAAFLLGKFAPIKLGVSKDFAGLKTPSLGKGAVDRVVAGRGFT